MNLILLEEVLDHIHNWFVRDSSVFEGVEISGGTLPSDVAEYVPEGVYYRLQGSYLNDGVHMPGEESDELRDETIARAKVSLLAIPRALLAIVDEIDEWVEKYGEVAQGPFFSEEFGGYKYTIRGYSSYGAASASASGWRLAFAGRLNPYRKPY